MRGVESRSPVACRASGGNGKSRGSRCRSPVSNCTPRLLSAIETNWYCAAVKTASIAKDNPLGLAIGAAAAGFLVGLVIPATRREDEKLGPVADSVKETKEAVNSLTTVVGHTVGLMGELTVKMGHFAEQGRRTDEHLDELAGEVRELAEQGRRTDARLDRLAELFDRHLRDDHGRKPS